MRTQDRPVKLQVGSLEREILKFIAQSEKPTLKDICAKFNLGKRRAGRIIVDLMRAQAVQSHTTEKTEFFSAVY
jgi:predicted transcriptional regulator